MQIEILDYKPFQKNTLQGFVDLKMTNAGLTIKGCTYHEKNGKRWIGLPGRPYQNEHGQTTYANILYFDEDFHAKFQAAALRALAEYLRTVPEEPQGDITF